MRIDVEPLKADVREFIKLTGMAESTFGRYGMGDPGFVQRIETADKMEFSTAVKCREFMVRVLDDARNPESRLFRGRMADWLDVNPMTEEKCKPEPKEEAPVTPPTVQDPPPPPEAVQQVEEVVAAKPEPAPAPRKGRPPEGKAAREAISVANKRLKEAQERTEQAKKIVGTSVGAQLQEVALADDVKDAVNVLKRKWPDLWKQICRLAQQSNERPISMMISMLEAQVAGAGK